MSVPRLIAFQHIGGQETGYISVAEIHRDIPFSIQRVYWVYDTPAGVERGNHANYSSEHVLICLKGSVSVFMQDIERRDYQFLLNHPDTGLYVPPLYWRRLSMTPDTICLSISSTVFEEQDYIKDYQEFLKLKK